MDLEQIKELGRKTNRIIEIDRAQKSVHELASITLKDESVSLVISLDITSDKVSDMEIPGFLKNRVLSSLPPDFESACQIMACSNKRIQIQIAGGFQMIILDAVVRALQSEQKDISASIKI